MPCPTSLRLVLTLTLASAGAGAQRSIPVGIQVGDRVRFTTARSMEQTGTIDGFVGDSVTIALARSYGNATLHLDDLRSLSLSLGPRSPGEAAKRGAIIGMLAGLAATGIAGGLLAYDCSRGDACFGTEIFGLMYLGSFAVVGGTLGGALLGASLPGELWRPIVLPRSPEPM
jgi:hypothetical protein